MKKSTSLLTKLWLEEVEIHKSNKDVLKYEKLKFNLKKPDVQLIQLFLKKHRLKWEVLIEAIWGLLLNRLSCSEEILYGVTEILPSRNSCKLLQNIKPIKSILNTKISLKSYINKITSQSQKSWPAHHSVSEEIRYLLAFKGKEAKKTFGNLDSTRFPLVFYVDKKNFATFEIFYNATSFTNDNLISIVDHLIVLLTDSCKDINQKVFSINILTKFEKQKILTEWLEPTFDFKLPKLTESFPKLFHDIALKNPKHLAISHDQVKFSYGELDNISTSIAKTLLEKGVQPGDCVCVFMERSSLWIAAILGILKIGAIYTPINPKFPEERIDYVIEDSQAKFILVNNLERLGSKHHHSAIILKHLQMNAFDQNTSQTFALPMVSLQQIAYIIYTSGTTGKPKGVMIKHESLTNLAAWYMGCFKLNADDRVSQFGSQGFDSHLCEIIPALAAGASLHIVDDNTKLTPSLFFDWLQKYKITVCDLTTAYAQMLFTMHWPKQMEMRLMKIGGESLTHYPSPEMHFDVWNIYGPTETTIETTFMKIHSAGKSLLHEKSHTPPIGKPIAGSKIYLVDKNLQPVPIGVAGELLIGGVVISAGYLNRDDLTKEKFITNPLKKSDLAKFYRTGDLARWLPDGNLEFVGRIDNQIKLRGYRIELGDIENAISQHSDVSETVVLLTESISKEKSLVAYITPNLDKQRYLYQQPCLLSTDQKRFIETITEDISKNGLALSGLMEPIPVGKTVQLRLKLPSFSESKLLVGKIIWQQDRRCGIVFDMPSEEMKVIEKSIDYYLASNNVMELVLSASAKRNLRKALHNQLPEYMIPSVFVTMMNFPLTLSGKVDLKSLPPPQNLEQLVHREFIAAKTPTEKKLALIWQELLHKDKVSMNENFFDLGGTSLSAADLSVQILKKFKTSIPAKVLFDLSYIPILAEFIDSNGAHYSQQPFIHEEIIRDCSLADNIIPTKQLSKSLRPPQNILLTGAGGFLGIYFLRELLISTQAKIYCLIRKNEFETAAKRLMETVQKFNLGNEISLNDRRIVVVASDLSFDNFGLPLEQYNSLLDKIDLIYHCGAQVNIMASYNKIRSSNVLGTLEVIKFATHHVDKPIHYISTLSSAYLKDEEGLLTESFPDDNYTDLFGGYAISKWVSERLLTKVKNHGLPISIYRSGYISGDSRTGVTSTNDALLLLIKGCIQLGFAPDFEECITILPVNFVSKAIINISLTYPDKSNVYHVDHPTGILWTDLVAWLNNYGYKVKVISMKAWQEKLITIPKTNALYPFLPYYLAMPEMYYSPRVNITNAAEALKNAKIAYPEMDDTLLNIYFKYLCDCHFLPTPEGMTGASK